MNLETPQAPPPAAPPGAALPPSGPNTPLPPRRPFGERAPGDGVRALLAAVRTRQRRLLWTTGALWGLAALLVLVAAAGFAGRAGAGWGRALLVLAPVAAALVAVYFGVWRALAQVGDEARTARLVGARKPELSLDALSAVELLRDARRADGDGAPAHSEALARAFLEQVDGRAARVDPRGVVDPRPLRTPALGALVALLVLVLAAGLGGARWREGLARIFAGPGSPAAAAALEPITGDVELTYQYPAYTGLAPRTVSGTTGEVSAPAGTEVKLRTRSDRPVERAEVVLQTGGAGAEAAEALPLRVEGGRELSGGFIAKRSGTYRFVFRDARGREVAVGPDLPVTVTPDAPPQVTLSTPAAEVEVDPGQAVALRFEAQDDYGLTGLELVYRTPRGQEQRVKLRLDDARATRGGHTWQLAGLQLQPGDRVTYHVEARDNDAVEGPKKGVSRTQVLKVYSAAEHVRAALEKTEALWWRMVDHLADRLEAPERETKGATDVQALTAGATVDARGFELTEAMRTLASELRREKDAPLELVAALVNISQGVGRRVRATADLRRQQVRLQRLHPGDVGFAPRLSAAMEEEVGELERSVLYLEGLLDRHKMEQLQEVAKQLASERRELARTLEDLKNSKTDEARDAALKQIDAVRQRMSELARRMAELQKGIRDEHLNAEALQEMMQEQDVGGALDELEKLVREGKTDEAMAKLQELSMQMDEMLQSLDEGAEQAGSQLDPELAKKFGDFMKDLGETAAEQKRVADQTRALRDKARAANKERLAERGKQLRQELQQEVQALEKRYAEVPAEQLPGRAAQALEEAQKELENADNALQVNDFDLAAEAAERAARATRRLAEAGEQQAQLDEEWGNPPDVQQQSKEMAGRLQRDARRARDVSQKLQSLFPEPGSQLSEADRQRLQQLAQQQRGLQQKAQGLQQQMEEMQQMAPVFGEDASQQMDQVGQRMGEASERMQARDANRGHGEQQAALEELQRFEQAMKQAQKGRGKGGLPMPMMAGQQQGQGANNQEKVELPPEDAYQAPKEFRQDLLDAMKQGAPEKYRDQVKRFYEELVK